MDWERTEELKDGVLSEEIELLGTFVLAVSGVDRCLTPAEVDQVLDARHTLP